MPAREGFIVNKKKVVSGDSFIEALRDLSGGISKTIVKDVVKGIPEAALNQLAGKTRSGELKPGQAINLEEKNEQVVQVKKFQQEFLDIRRQEKLIYTRTEQEGKLQIKALQEELKKLVESTRDLVQEVEVAAKQAPVEPGVYHLNFFIRLRQTILLFKKRIEESATWLAAFNQRAKKRNYYWTQIKKSGTRFMLSQERYMATQAG